MSDIATDPIISVYIKLLNKTQSEFKLPEFSEIYLRLAFKEVCGKNYLITTENLQLYRKLLVLYYCEQYPYLASVINIMERCFTREDINDIISEQDKTLTKWRNFINNYIRDNKVKKRKICLLDDEILKKKINI